MSSLPPTSQPWSKLVLEHVTEKPDCGQCGGPRRRGCRRGRGVRVHQILRGERLSRFVYVWTFSQGKDVKCWAQGGPCLSDCWRPWVILVSTEGSASGPRGSPGLTYTPSPAPVYVPDQLPLCASLVPCPCVCPWSQLQVQLPDPEEAG